MSCQPVHPDSSKSSQGSSNRPSQERSSQPTSENHSSSVRKERLRVAADVKKPDESSQRKNKSNNKQASASNEAPLSREQAPGSPVLCARDTSSASPKSGMISPASKTNSKTSSPAKHMDSDAGVSTPVSCVPDSNPSSPVKDAPRTAKNTRSARQNLFHDQAIIGTPSTPAIALQTSPASATCKTAEGKNMKLAASTDVVDTPPCG
jgi:hypothetical protein